jgi:alpha-glucosidase
MLFGYRRFLLLTMADFGYDIANYTDVDPLFGSIADLDRLISAAHRNRLKIILDLVPNHTSDQHPWFIESKASRTSEVDPGPGTMDRRS